MATKVTRMDALRKAHEHTCANCLKRSDAAGDCEEWWKHKLHNVPGDIMRRTCKCVLATAIDILGGVLV